MKIKSFKEMDKKQLMDKIMEIKKEMIKQNAQTATGTTSNSSGQIKESKKTIARIKTVLNEKRGTKHE